MAEPTGARAEILAVAPWLTAADLGTCVVGSAALAEACARAGVPGPASHDLDLAWALDPAAGEALLRERGVFEPTTEANRARGTLALRLGAKRVEITSFRAGDPRAPMAERIAADLCARDMSVGALAWWLAEDRILDPLRGLEHWRERRIVAAGDPAERIREHPVRHLRYYRRAHEWGFTVDPAIRRVTPDPRVLARIPGEALAAELRFGLLRAASPGRFLLEVHEVGLLPHLLPELAPQFDGRPAGPIRHHPEVSQAQHLVLALEWAVRRVRDLPEADRLAVLLAVLMHDLGKSATTPAEWPSHRGHEREGVKLLHTLLARVPSLADTQTVRLCEAVCELHLLARQPEALRPGTQVDLYEEWLRRGLRDDLFALALGADVGGRLGREAEGDALVAHVRAFLARLRARCESVDAAALRAQCGDDLPRFRALLHEARARALRDG